MLLSNVLETHRVVVCVGCGGVGKTTTAAALALSSAMAGKRVLCLTIDPARRLANSLGLSVMKTEEQMVPKELFDAAGLERQGSLSAMMLDTKRTFDDLVRHYASTNERAERILSNQLYQYISTSLAGTQEYMAMEKLYAIKDDPRFDLIILDTPPTSNALDFLEAPEKLVGIIDSPAVRWMLQALTDNKTLSFNLIGKSAALLLKGLATFTGAEFLDEVARFLIDINELFGGFKQRAEKVAKALRSDDVAFVVVTSPNPLAIEESLFFEERLRIFGMRPHAFVINRIHPLHPEPNATDAQLAEELQKIAPSLNGADAVVKLTHALDDERQRAIADRLAIEELRNRAGTRTMYIEVPALDEDVHDLRSLAEVASYLVGARSTEIVDRG